MKPKSLFLSSIACALMFTAFAVTAQTYPTKPIRLIIPFAPGGIFDYIGRLISPKLSESMGQYIVIDNRSGGGSVIAMQYTAKAAPDGYTVLLADPSIVINPSLRANVGYDLKELSAVTVLTTASLVLTVNAKVPAKTVEELIKLSKTSKVSYGSAGIGTTPHMAAELFKNKTNADILHVPFKGIGPAVTAIVSNEVQVVFGSVAGTLGYMKDGRLRGLATTGEKRALALPNLPTIAEAGCPGCEVAVWGTIFVPKGTPPAIVAKLNQNFNNVLKEPDVKTGLDRSAIEPLGTTPAAADAFILKELAKWSSLIKARNIVAQ